MAARSTVRQWFKYPSDWVKQMKDSKGDWDMLAEYFTYE